MSEQAQAQAQQDGKTVLTLALTLDETNVVLSGLGELPAKHTFGLIAKIQQQAAVQLQPQPEAPAAAE